MENGSREGPLGEVIPHKDHVDPRTGGGSPQERVEDWPAVSQVTPEDYPEDQRRQSRPDIGGTSTQPNPNLSTEHQKEGDARHPRDILDRDDVRRDPESGAPIPDDQ